MNMKFITRPWFILNRAWEKLIADELWVIETDNKEAIEVLNVMFPIKKVETKKEVK